MSGGMRQRVMIAMALACEPDLLIADEPTTALDVTVQAQILDLLRDLQQQTGMAIILITHDLGVVAEMADEVAVMYAGRVVERAPGTAIFDDPQHPYTLGLLGTHPEDRGNRATACWRSRARCRRRSTCPQGCRFHPRCVFAVARLHRRPIRRCATLGAGHRAACIRAPRRSRRSPGRWPCMATPLLEVEDLAKHYPVKRGLVLAKTIGTVRAVDGISFSARHAARRWRWSARAAAASPPPPGWCCG